MSKVIIGVMGPGAGASPVDLDYARELGRLIATEGWILLTGGREAGVMDAASQGAKQAGGLTVGVLPGRDRQGMSAAVDIAIVTDLGNGRNNVNVLTSDVVIACGMGAGTASEIALAIKNYKPLILLNLCDRACEFFHSLAPHQVKVANNPKQAIEMARGWLDKIRKMRG